ncbi:hypothetical protein EIP86_011165 [Pleurotus ostreatoroseus]|nr:hypothetical protein EIP86_011165 [Pleurotus ostreatoroseus]
MVKYVVTGTTGGLGSQVFKYLIRLVPVSDIIVSLHNPAGATPEVLSSGVEIRKGDFAQPETLHAAYAGADKLLIVSCPTINYELSLKSHIAAIDAAKRASIKHVYYTSLAWASDSKALIMQAHLDTEAYLKQSGITYTIIREGVYSESFWFYLPYQNRTQGHEVKIPYGDGKISFVSREDLGEGTAKLMVADTHKNKTVLFTGPQVYTASDLANMITNILKLDPPLRVKIVSEDEYVASTDGGEGLLRKWASTFTALARGELAAVDPLLQTILGRECAPLEQTVREIVGATSE